MQSFTRIIGFLAAAAPFVAAAPVAPREESTDIPGKYLVQLKPNTDIASIAAHHNKVREIHARNLARRDGQDESVGKEREFQLGDFVGYSGSFDDATIEELKALPEVLAVENDYIMSTSALVTQNNAPWGLGRVSARAPGATSYIYDDTAGQGTFSYVVDTGIRTTHSDFGGRAVWGFNSVSGTSNTDNNGHGTHVAGTVGGATYGVAKKTTLVAVKVFEGSSGTASQVISGFEWAANDIVNKGRQNTAVINMSLGGRASTTWDAAITAAWSRGVLSVVASGNDNANAANYSPARSPEAITVGNSRSDDSRYSGTYGSNYGSVVDIFAPGTDILSADYRSDTGSQRLSGTSMASPHVAGLVSYVRGLEGASSASAVKARVLALATPGRITGTQGEANLLGYNGNGR